MKVNLPPLAPHSEEESTLNFPREERIQHQQIDFRHSTLCRRVPHEILNTKSITADCSWEQLSSLIWTLFDRVVLTQEVDVFLVVLSGQPLPVPFVPLASHCVLTLYRRSVQSPENVPEVSGKVQPCAVVPGSRFAGFSFATDVQKRRHSDPEYL